MLALFVPIAILSLASLITLASISPHLFYLQVLWLALGVSIVYLFATIDWRSLFGHQRLIAAFYSLSVAMLLFVYLRGPVIRHVKSWIVLGPLSFQPVEFAKVVLILLYAQYFRRRHLAVARWKYVIVSLALCALPAALVMLQPNLGFAIILSGIWFGTLLISGLPMRRILPLAAALLLFGALLWSFGMKEYQRQRITAFFSPQERALSINYNTIQSEIAIGSAGFWGAGFHQGSQVQLGFLPVPESDFIYAAFVEEWGFLGGIVVLLSFAVFISAIAKIGMDARQNSAKYICTGTIIMFLLQFSFNLGSTLGLMPVVGIPLPFMSYGGTDLIAGFFLLALINSIRLSNQGGVAAYRYA